MEIADSGPEITVTAFSPDHVPKTGRSADLTVTVFVPRRMATVSVFVNQEVIVGERCMRVIDYYTKWVEVSSWDRVRPELERYHYKMHIYLKDITLADL